MRSFIAALRGAASCSRLGYRDLCKPTLDTSLRSGTGDAMTGTLMSARTVRIELVIVITDRLGPQSAPSVLCATDTCQSESYIGCTPKPSWQIKIERKLRRGEERLLRWARMVGSVPRSNGDAREGSESHRPLRTKV